MNGVAEQRSGPLAPAPWSGALGYAIAVAIALLTFAFVLAMDDYSQVAERSFGAVVVLFFGTGPARVFGAGRSFPR